MAREKILSWPAIIGITAATGVVVGLALGLLGSVLGLSSTSVSAGVGAPMGIVAALLITRRRAALAAQSQR